MNPPPGTILTQIFIKARRSFTGSWGFKIGEVNDIPLCNKQVWSDGNALFDTNMALFRQSYLCDVCPICSLWNSLLISCRAVLQFLVHCPLRPKLSSLLERKLREVVFDNLDPPRFVTFQVLLSFTRIQQVLLLLQGQMQFCFGAYVQVSLSLLPESTRFRSRYSCGFTSGIVVQVLLSFQVCYPLTRIHAVFREGRLPFQNMPSSL